MKNDNDQGVGLGTWGQFLALAQVTGVVSLSMNFD